MKSLYISPVLAFAGMLSFALMGTRTNSQLSNTNHAANAAFQDGLYLGALAARRAETPHVAFGRWATANDRQSFIDGYTEAYEQTLALMLQEKPHAQNNNAAYRDGLYLGRLDAEQGRPQQISSGRWAQLHDRESFTAGYRQAYADTAALRVEKVKGTAEATLVR